MPAVRGPLLLADISGYTAFVAGTELEHSRAILNELLEMLVRAIARHLRIGQIEGDAVFGVGEQVPPRPLEWLEECFVSYHRRIRDIQEVTTCPCRACANVGSLTLKFIAHFGEYMSQHIRSNETFVGHDVNIAHRLLKNSVPSHEYIFVTNAFLDRMPTNARAGFVAHTERYDAGEVSGAYKNLAELRAQARSNSERRLVESDHARLTVRRTYKTTRERLWQVLIDPKTRARWMAARIDYRSGARGSLLGSEYHCEHRMGPTVLRVVSTDAPDQLTTVARNSFALVWETSRIRDSGTGSVELERSFHWERGEGIKGWVTESLLGIMGRASAGMTFGAIDAILREDGAQTTAPPATQAGA